MTGGVPTQSIDHEKLLEGEGYSWNLISPASILIPRSSPRKGRGICEDSAFNRFSGGGKGHDQRSL
ncbi:MAG TPA: hypothetical protein VF478_05215, partial [Anaerolineae bacterium]